MERGDTQNFKVVINHEEQYSIWPADSVIPRGWKATGREGQEKQCLDYIEEVWTDMRPLSLSKALQETAALIKRDAGS